VARRSRVDPERARLRRDDAIVLKLVEALGAGECEAPLAPMVLEKLATGSLEARKAGQARDHIAQCVYCVNAYAEVLNVLEMPTPAEVMEEESEVRRQRASQTPSDVGTQVSELIREIERETRYLRHRTVQREYSEPSLFEEERDPGRLPFKKSRSVSKSEPSSRSAEEQRAFVAKFMGLVKQHGRLATRVKAAKVAPFEKQRLLGELEEAREAISHALQQLGRPLRV
jgi:hypothetical protein